MPTHIACKVPAPPGVSHLFCLFFEALETIWFYFPSGPGRASLEVK